MKTRAAFFIAGLIVAFLGCYFLVELSLNGLGTVLLISGSVVAGVSICDDDGFYYP